jgi:hypothetical protein
LERLLDTGSRIVGVEAADGQEPELAQRFSASWHVSVLLINAERACLYGDTPSPVHKHARSR